MTWNYRVFKRSISNEIVKDYPVYSIDEAYYHNKTDSVPHNWTEGKNSLQMWEELEDLKGSYQMINEAFNKPIVEIYKDENGKDKARELITEPTKISEISSKTARIIEELNVDIIKHNKSYRNHNIVVLEEITTEGSVYIHSNKTLYNGWYSCLLRTRTKGEKAMYIIAHYNKYFISNLIRLEDQVVCDDKGKKALKKVHAYYLEQ